MTPAHHQPNRFDPTTWIILRTAGRTTMRLAETLVADGFEAWTPIETKSFRKPRDNVRRSIRLPLMPSYVFARADRLIDLLEIAKAAERPRRGQSPAHTSFSVMHWNEGIPVIADRQLEQLRRIEAKRTPLKKANRALTSGVEVRVKLEGGSFAGMRGRVERSDNSTTLVCFNKRMTVKIATSLLSVDDLCVDVIGLKMAKAA